jgi:ribosome-associated protein
MNSNKTLDRLSESSEYIAKEAVKVLLEKKGISVKLYDVKEQTSVTDYYVNATGNSGSHVLSLADDVDEKITELGRSALRIEGRAGREWLLVDFGDVIVNIFDRSARDFYNLDRLIPEGSEVDIMDLLSEVEKKFEINKN